MPAEDDISLDEKRVYGTARTETAVYVAGGMGITRVTVSGAQIGRYTLVEQCDARDVAGGDGRLLVATATDVLVGVGEGVEPTGFGPAVAVGLDGRRALAAGPDGRVARLSGDEWTTLGTIPDVRAIDGPLVAAADGVYHVGSDVDHVGLDDARDVAAAGPFAATATGLFQRHDGWAGLFDGAFTVVAATGERAHAVGASVWVREGPEVWGTVDMGVDTAIVDIAYGECPYAVTADGTLLVEASAGDTPDGTTGWRSRALGIQDARAVAVP